MIGVAAVMVVTAMGLVRLGWNGRPAIAALGWLFAAAALILLVLTAGAWGLAVGSVVGVTAALVALAWSGWNAPGHAPRPGPERAASAFIREPARLARRAAVFLLVVPVGGGAALWLAFAAQAAARRVGMSAADASGCLLLLTPFLWCALLTWQITRDSPRHMATAPLLAIAIGALLWAAR